MYSRFAAAVRFSVPLFRNSIPEPAGPTMRSNAMILASYSEEIGSLGVFVKGPASYF